MCDERTLKDWARYLEDAPPVSRRRFGALTAGAGVAAALPPVAAAQFQPILTGMVEIETPDGDDANDPEAKSTLRESFDAAGLAAEIEVYEGAQHGWCVPDSAVYHDEQAERAWSRLLALFERALA